MKLIKKILLSDFHEPEPNHLHGKVLITLGHVSGMAQLMIILHSSAKSLNLIVSLFPSFMITISSQNHTFIKHAVHIYSFSACSIKLNYLSET